MTLNGSCRTVADSTSVSSNGITELGEEARRESGRGMALKELPTNGDGWKTICPPLF